MRTSRQVVLLGLTVAFTFLSFTRIAAAEPKDEVEAAAAAWAQAPGEDDPDKVLPLYSSDAVLWGTLSPKLRSDPAALRDYFVGAFKVLAGLKVVKSLSTATPLSLPIVTPRRCATEPRPAARSPT